MMNMEWMSGSGHRVVISGLVLSLLLLLVPGAVAAEEAGDIYLQDVPEMTTLECARCHVQVFEALRDRGDLHKQPCRDCHDTFHTFTPGVPWEERVPACTGCHDHPHGEALNGCLECHKNAHAPVESLVAAEKLAELCDRCHPSQRDELTQTASAHSEQACFACHQGDQHGERPQCNLCHAEPHAPFTDNAGCASCHPPHAPTAISYDNKVPNSICGGCHGDQLEIQQASDKRHKSLACVICHAKEHGQIPACQTCHGNGPHNPILLQNFSSCIECHGDPHNLKLSE